MNNKKKKFPQPQKAPAPQPVINGSKTALQVSPPATTPPPQAPEDALLASATPQQLEAAAPLAQQQPLPNTVDDGRERLRLALAVLEKQKRDHEEAALELETQLNERQRKLEDQERKLEDQQRKLDRRDENLRAERQELEEHKARLDERSKKIGEERLALDDRSTTVKRSEAQLQELQKQLLQKQSDAEAGFLAERRASLKKLEEEREVLRRELEDVQAQRSRETAAAHERAVVAQTEDARRREDALRKLEEELHARRQRYEEELQRWRDDQRAALAREQERLTAEQDRQQRASAELQRAQRKCQIDREELDEDHKELDELVQQHAAAALERLELDRQALEERLREARGRSEALDARLRERDEADRRFGQRSPDDVLRELEGLRDDNLRLQQQLAERPDRAAAERLQRLEGEREAWEAEHHKLRQQAEELQGRLTQYRLGAAETERLRDERTMLETHNQMLRGHLNELKSEVERRLGEETSKACFPALLKLDQDAQQQERPAMDDAPLKLEVLVAELRERMAQMRPPLYYHDADLRCFLGGLAASKLVLLQGISGTGKTSLPRAVADALMWGHDKIEVQAGWRDRDDLIGHYNAFERRFHERPFLQALYRAQGPRYADQPFLVVLDEMNLSHPEQYFADLLSALEEPQAERRFLRLLPHADGAGPRLLQEGRDLRVPRNLWFVGTANHDETTKDFADKTYDRAHVMELPRQPARPGGTVREPRLLPLSLNALENAFRRAQKEHQPKARLVIDHITNTLADLLDKRFRIGFGNRLERQIDDFVPVVLAAGGSLTEAADHLLTTKLLRRLRDRYDVAEKDLRKLRRSIDQDWSKLDPKNKPHKGLTLIDRELNRLSGTERA